MLCGLSVRNSLCRLQNPHSLPPTKQTSLPPAPPGLGPDGSAIEPIFRLKARVSSRWDGWGRLRSLSQRPLQPSPLPPSPCEDLLSTSLLSVSSARTILLTASLPSLQQQVTQLPSPANSPPPFPCPESDPPVTLGVLAYASPHP